MYVSLFLFTCFIIISYYNLSDYQILMERLIVSEYETNYCECFRLKQAVIMLYLDIGFCSMKFHESIWPRKY